MTEQELVAMIEAARSPKDARAAQDALVAFLAEHPEREPALIDYGEMLELTATAPSS